MTARLGHHRRLDRYELLAEIASGGMGSVLLARLGGAGGFERLFAIKVMHPHLMSDPQFVGMLLEEARLAAKIHHPNVVATVDVGQSGGFYYIVMDYIDGFPLARILDGGLFDNKERIRIVNRLLLDAMSGLSAAHTLRGPNGARLGIVHRDVSPQNILVGTDGVARLTDFGIAQAASQLSGSRSDTVKGKPSYLAPEQATGREVDLRADLWALGVILWEGITGRRLFVAETEAATVQKVLSEPIPSPAAYYADVPADLEALCLRALDRDPSRRPKSARDMLFELEQIADEAGLLADSHEVSDLLRERLGHEIEARRRTIQRYGAPAGVEVLPASLRDVQALPKLADDAGPAASKKAAAIPVGLATMPASRLLLRTTPAGTASESPPPKPRRMTGVFALLALFALGSLTTLVLLHFRLLNDFALAPVAAPRDGADGRTVTAAALAPAVSPAPREPSGSGGASGSGVSPGSSVASAPSVASASSVALASSVAPASTVPSSSGVGAPSGSAASSAAHAPTLTPASVQPEPTAAVARAPQPARTVQKNAQAPRSRQRVARAVADATVPDVPALPVEENPYRLQ